VGATDVSDTFEPGGAGRDAAGTPAGVAGDLAVCQTNDADAGVVWTVDFAERTSGPNRDPAAACQHVPE
jgi:hypothetical protein